MDDEERRKLQAKRFNEHVRLLFTTINAGGLVVIGAGVIQPIIASGASAVFSEPRNWAWIGLGVALHLIAQSLIRLIRAE